MILFARVDLVVRSLFVPREPDRPFAGNKSLQSWNPVYPASPDQHGPEHVRPFTHITGEPAAACDREDGAPGRDEEEQAPCRLRD